MREGRQEGLSHPLLQVMQSILHEVGTTVLPHLAAGALWLRKVTFLAHTQPKSNTNKTQSKWSDTRPHTPNLCRSPPRALNVQCKNNMEGICPFIYSHAAMLLHHDGPSLDCLQGPFHGASHGTQKNRIFSPKTLPQPCSVPICLLSHTIYLHSNFAWIKSPHP